ncbi:hypothetical protein [Paraglaciecola sp.]|uniref:hypothetical protein n=1 Tax=Paraglaciecola sp. TaxID=1920173 RepID=UPI003EF366C1
MKVAFEHYQKPKPKGGTGSIRFHLLMGVPLVLLIAVLISMNKTEPEPLIVLSVVAIVMAGLFIKGLFLLWRNSSLASKLKDDAAVRVFEQNLAFSLLLRPFDFDGFIPVLPNGTDSIADLQEHNHKNAKLSSFEMTEFDYMNLDAPVELFDLVSNAIVSAGTLLAVGERKSDHIGGPGLLQVEDGNWKESVAQYMQKTSCIIIMPWPTEGTLWEVNEIITHNLMDKTVFIMPPNYSFKKETRMVSHSIDNGGDKDFHYRVPNENLCSNNPLSEIKDGYNKAIEPLINAGFTPPEYDPNGALYYFNKNQLMTFPIPYHKSEIKAFIQSLNRDVFVK